MYSNKTKQRLQAGDIAYGLGIRSARTPETVLAASVCGYDYLFIDAEHSTLNLDTIAHLSATALAAGVTPIVRVPSAAYPDLPRILDGGAQGLVVPHIRNADDARAAVAAARFPPLGRRSGAGAAIQLGWASLPEAEACARLNEQLLLVAMIECRSGLENVEEIAAVDGIDVLSVGTNDLTLDLGVPNDFFHPAVEAAHTRVVAAARRHGKAVRLGGRYGKRDVDEAIRRGATFVTLATDTTLIVNGIRAAIADRRPVPAGGTT